MKKVLMIAYAYPPSSRVGTFRPLRFSRYLPGEGWQPIILTLKEKKFDSLDYSLLENIPQLVKIHRTSAFLFHRRYTRAINTLYKLLSGLRKPKSRDTIANNAINNNKRSDQSNNDRIVWKHLLGDILKTPDEAVGWVPFAFIKGLYLIYKYDIDVIYATGGPFTSFITGMWLKSITGRPLVIDFRDAWASNCLVKWSHPVFSRISRSLEKKVLANADMIIANTPTIKKQFISEHSIDEKKVIVIHNGFDKMDLQDLSNYNYDKFTISYIGALTSYRDPMGFLQALKELLDEKKIVAEKIQVMFTGPGTDRYKDTIVSLGLEKVVILASHVSHKEALNLMSSSHLLLLLGCSAPYAITSKVFEYIAVKKPILAINSEGDLNNLFLTEDISGEIVDLGAVRDIKKAINKFYLQYQAGEMAEQTEELLDKFDCKHLTQLLAGIFNNISPSQV